MKRTLFLSFVGVIASVLCYGDTVYDVSLDTASLVDNSNAPFALDFQLTSGNTGSGVVNTATLSQFNFGTGGRAAAGSPFPNSGNASGDLTSTVTLNTSAGSFFNEFSQNFTAGDTLTFRLDLTNNAQPPPTPDEFTFQLIDKSNAEIPTTDPSGSNSLVVIDLTGSELRPQVYTTSGDGVRITPQVSSQVSSVPEPESMWLSGLALLAFLVLKESLTKFAESSSRSTVRLSSSPRLHWPARARAIRVDRASSQPSLNQRKSRLICRHLFPNLNCSGKLVGKVFWLG